MIKAVPANNSQVCQDELLWSFSPELCSLADWGLVVILATADGDATVVGLAAGVGVLEGTGDGEGVLVGVGVIVA